MKKLLVFAFLSVVLACTEQPEVIPFNYTKVFTGETSRGFILRSIHFLQEGKTPAAFDLSDFAPCTMDDVYEFHNTPERRFVITEGASKCNSSDPDIFVEDSWSFVNANATLTIPFPLLGGIAPFIVREVDDRDLVLEIYFDENKQGYRFSFRAVSGG
jgi:hypothetical protein